MSTLRRKLTRLAVIGWAATCIASTSEAAELSSQGDDPVDREIMVVFVPSAVTPDATDIVSNSTASQGVSSYRQAFAKAEFVQKWSAPQVLSADDLVSLSARNPRAPEVLASQVIIVRYPTGTDIDAELKVLRSDSRVLDASRNFRMQFSAVPVDPYFSVNAPGNPYGFPVTPANSQQGKYQWGMAVMRFPQAWDRVRGNAYVADVNAGVYWQSSQTHLDLQKNFRPQFSAHVSANDGLIHTLTDAQFDESVVLGAGAGGHGTHVAGIIAATPNNSLGVAGGCWFCSLMAVATNTTAEMVGAAIFKAMANGAQVINLSLGVVANGELSQYANSDYCTIHPSLPPCNAIVSALNRQIVIVASSGNDTYRVQFPANQMGVFAIGGLQYAGPTPSAVLWTQGYPIPGFPSPPVGTNCLNSTQAYRESGTNCGSQQLVVAPAKDIATITYLNGNYSSESHCVDRSEPENPGDLNFSSFYPTGQGYGTCTGTSMAAPHVSALVALMRTSNPLLAVDDIRRLVQRNASGNDVRIDDAYGHGIPYADNSVISVLSGASLSNPTLFNASVKNRLTPLFGFYSAQARNNFYTVVPQMAAVAITGTLVPSPKLHMNASSYSANCAVGNPCSGATVTPAQFSPSIVVLNPDDTPSGAGRQLRLDYVSGYFVTPSPAVTITDASGVAQATMVWPFLGNINYQATIAAAPIDDYVLPYTAAGVGISSYIAFPGVSGTPKSIASVYVTHVNPLGSGPDLEPLYRLSWRCGDSPLVQCTTGAVGKPVNKFHVSHVYVTSADVATYQSAGYKLDGIEGYIFPTSYAAAPQAGMVYLCQSYDDARDEYILHAGTGVDGRSCGNPPFPPWTDSYYVTSLGALGWVVPNYNGSTAPTIAFTAPVNNSSFAVGSSIGVTVSASASTASVRYYVDGVLRATKSASPFSWTWVPTNPDIGARVLYAVATNSAGVAVTSAKRKVTITGTVTLPTIGNSGFEAPSVGTGYQYGPTGASWTFIPIGPAGGSGVAGNGSGFTFLNPNAPAGTQVGFIQGSNSITQTLNFPSTGSFKINFYGAQRVNNGSHLLVDVNIDGVSKLQINPPVNGTYTFYSTNSFTINTTGNHTLSFVGTNDGLDNTIFIDQVTVSTP